MSNSRLRTIALRYLIGKKSNVVYLFSSFVYYLFESQLTKLKFHIELHASVLSPRMT